MYDLVKKSEDIFEDYLSRFFDGSYFRTPTVSSAAGRSNIIENENEYIIEVAVPGFKKDDINIDLDDGILSISSEVETSSEDKNDGYFRKEFSKVSFIRSFRIPDDVKIDKADASMSDGILSIKFPKTEEKKTKKLQISIK